MLRTPLLLTVLAALLPAQKYRAFWADAFHEGFKTPAQVDRMVEHLQLAKANAVFIQARRRGDSYYLQSIEPVAEDAALAPGFDPLEYLIQKAHAAGIEVHAWFIVYLVWFENSAPPRNPGHVWNLHGVNASGEEDWAMADLNGRRSAALDPGHPAVLPYLLEVFLEPVRRYDLDGIHLDRVRYSEDSDYGYNPAALERFNRHAGRAGRPGRTDPVFQQWRRDQVTALVRRLYLRLQEIRPSTKLSAAVITWGDGPSSDAQYRTKDAYSRVYQDWRGWLEEGILDFAVPMNYFRETQNANFLDRWMEYQKDRQYNRAYINGLGNYLNTTAQTLAQLERVFRPSAAGNTTMGVSLYSYSATRSDDPTQRPDEAFYRTLAEFFREPAKTPELSWKARPEKGHIMGTVSIEGAPAWAVDGLDVTFESADGSWRKETRTDVTGFFGAVDLLPGVYRARFARDGRLLHSSDPWMIEPGRVREVRIAADPATFAEVRPAIAGAGKERAAPGDLIRIWGRNLAREYGYATAVPLPPSLSGAVVLVNGSAAPLYEIGADFASLQLPFDRPGRWEIVVRRAGMDSQPFLVEFAEAAPEIVEVQNGGGILDIFATGLGPVSPAVPAGSASGETEPFSLTELPVRVEITAGEAQMELEPFYAGLRPWIPGLYLVRVLLPAGVNAGTARIRCGSARSNAAPF